MEPGAIDLHTNTSSAACLLPETPGQKCYLAIKISKMKEILEPTSVDSITSGKLKLNFWSDNVAMGILVPSLDVLVVSAFLIAVARYCSCEGDVEKG